MSMQVFLEKLRSLGMAQDCPGSSCAQGDGVAKVRHPFAYVWLRSSVSMARKFLPRVSHLENSVVHSSKHVLLFFWLNASSDIRNRSSTLHHRHPLV